MKILLSILLSFATIIANATVYYVSNTGSDVANGTSTATPWQTITRVNTKSASGELIPGDQILFKRGDTFTGAIVVSEGGAFGNQITYGAYGTGANPIISGFTTISGWTNYGGGIYSKVVSTAATPQMVTLNGVNTPRGRWPKYADAQYYMYDSHGGDNSLTDAPLNGLNWSGGDVTVRENMGFLTTTTITGHSGSTIYFNDVFPYGILNGYGYFISNHRSLLTQLGEWAYISGTLYMYFGAADPDDYTVKIAALGNMIDLSNRSYVTIDNLTIEGGNHGIYTSASSYLNIQNNTIRYLSNTGIRFWGYGGGGGSYNVIHNNTFTEINDMGIECSWWREFNRFTITNNTLLNIGMFPGMGTIQNQSHVGIRCWADYSTIQYNHVTNTGYHGISFYGTNTVVRNNFVDGALSCKSDGGGIYTVQQVEPTVTGMEITDNIVINSVGVDPIYMPYTLWGGFGIYLDDRLTNCLIDGNLIYNCSADGIYLHGSINVTVSNNKSIGNAKYETGNYAQMRSSRDFAAEPHSTGLVFTNNQFIALNTTNPPLADALQYAAIFQAIDGESEIVASISSADYNYYAMPFFPNSGNLIRIWEGTFGVVSKWKTLAEWKTYLNSSGTGREAHSNVSQVNMTALKLDINDIYVIYNDTTAIGVNKTWNLSTTMYDVAGTSYSTSVTLAPWESLVLIGEGTVTLEGEEEPEPEPVIPTGGGYMKSHKTFYKSFGKWWIL